VLAVDDDETIRLLVCTMLERVGLRCLTAGGVEEANRILQRNDIDLVLSDIDMPGTNGLEFVRKLRQALPDVPVILMTGNGACYTRSMASEAGADEYLSKPFHRDDFLSKIGAFVSLPSNQRSACGGS